VKPPSGGLECWLAHLAGQADRIERPPSSGEWEEVAGLAELHNLRPLTYRRVVDGPFGSLMPGTIEQRLRPAYVDAAVRNALLLKHTGRLIAALAEEGIETIPLKGLHLSRFVYSEPALRGMADVDLLVRRDRLADAERVFVSRGFGPLPRGDVEERCRRSSHLAKLIKEGEPVFEVHWHVERPSSPFQIDPDELWSRSVGAELEGVPIRLLALEDLLHHVAIHGAYHHRFQRSALKMLVDLRAIMGAGDSLDWPAIVERANRWGTARYLYVALRVAREVLAVAAPAGALSGLRHTADDDRIAELSRAYLLELGVEVPSAYLELARASGLGSRAKHIWRHAFPPRPDMERIYGLPPDTWLGPRYLGRLGHLLAHRTGLLIGALTRGAIRQTAIDRQAARRSIEEWTGERWEDPEDD